MSRHVGEAILYCQITLAVHVDLATESVNRVVELREEIHPRDADPAMVLTESGLTACAPRLAAKVYRIAEEAPWPEEWEFGY